jgi:hypothetical protein
MPDMRAVAETATKFAHDVESVNRELKRIASVKCRIKKMPGRSDFQEKLTAALQYEELLKNVKAYIVGPRKNVNTITQEEVDLLTLDETMKALKAIQCKKTHTKWLTTEPGENDEYREACRIEQMLKDHRDAIAPKRVGKLSKADAMAIIDTVTLGNDMTVDECLEHIKKLIEEA